MRKGGKTCVIEPPLPKVPIIIGQIQMEEKYDTKGTKSYRKNSIKIGHNDNSRITMSLIFLCIFQMATLLTSIKDCH